MERSAPMQAALQLTRLVHLHAIEGTNNRSPLVFGVSIASNPRSLVLLKQIKQIKRRY